MEQRLGLLEGEQRAPRRPQAARLVHRLHHHMPLAATTVLPLACQLLPHRGRFCKCLFDPRLPRQPLDVLAILGSAAELHLDILRAISSEVANAALPLLSADVRA